MLARFQADPEQLHSIVSQARAKSHALDGRGLANLLSTCVLSEQFDESVYAWAMTSDMLRSRKYDDADVALLYHVHVALQHAAPVWYAHSKRIPVDIVAAAHRRLTSATERLQGMYDVLRLAFHRAGLPYSYRTVDKVGSVPTPRVRLHRALPLLGQVRTVLVMPTIYVRVRGCRKRGTCCGFKHRARACRRTPPRRRVRPPSLRAQAWKLPASGTA
ncbi:MAG: hypothetical protein EOO41_05160, partial [Methanobacteriota archaeon]